MFSFIKQAETRSIQPTKLRTQLASPGACADELHCQALSTGSTGPWSALAEASMPCSDTDTHLATPRNHVARRGQANAV